MRKFSVLLIFSLLFGMETSMAETDYSCLNQPGMACSGEFVNPKTPLIREDESIRGTVNAPLVLVKYSDFLCSYCAKASPTVKALLKKYEGKIQFIYKHFPLNPNSMVLSQYYEGLRLQGEEKAFQFHDAIFGNQLRSEEDFLNLMTRLNVDMDRLMTDINSTGVKERIAQDRDEAMEMGFGGTPGFLLNGVSVAGAYPMEHFEKIIDKLVEMGKVNLK